ncbi:PASTA domain-containing protein [Thermosipho atlanticus]|uniref:PASTA domain-containing protein n=1 Tax=Thermosipho atlanticus TaxID=238991 RepID=UPI0013565AB4|nr:PASTA domain-containing protein [Thermosipho atlanticus]
MGWVYYQEKINITYIPDVIGYDINEAQKILEKNDLKVLRFGNGKVINTIPQVGLVVKKGRIVRIFGKSMETNEYTIPNFFGVNYKTVIKILENWGLKVEVVKIRYPGPDGRVLATYPGAGKRIKTGDYIKILVDDGEIGGGQ